MKRLFVLLFIFASIFPSFLSAEDEVTTYTMFELRVNDDIEQLYYTIKFTARKAIPDLFIMAAVDSVCKANCASGCISYMRTSEKVLEIKYAKAYGDNGSKTSQILLNLGKKWFERGKINRVIYITEE